MRNYDGETFNIVGAQPDSDCFAECWSQAYSEYVVCLQWPQAQLTTCLIFANVNLAGVAGCYTAYGCQVDACLDDFNDTLQDCDGSYGGFDWYDYFF